MSDTEKIKIKSKKRAWHAQQEDILKEWSEQAGCYRWMHERSYQIYKKQNMRYSIPVIVISTVTGTANFAQNGFPESIKGWAPLIIGTLNLAAGLITTIAQFLRVSELLEGHRAASIAYSKLSRNIAVELSLPADERSMPGIDYIKQCRMDIDRLIEQSPPIPPDILGAFDKKVLQDNSSNPIEPLFAVPPILNLKPIQVFRTEIDEQMRIKQALQMKELEREQREKIIKEEQDKIESAIKAHEMRRQSIRGEVELESIAKKLQQEQKEKENVKDKLENLSISAITKKMAKFQNILIASDSDSDDDDDKPNFISLDINDNTNKVNTEITTIINDISDNIVDSSNITIDVSNNITTDVSNNNPPKKKLSLAERYAKKR